MADWDCVSETLNLGNTVNNERSNGVKRYDIRAENLAVEGGYVDLEIKFRDDWSKSTETRTLSSGQKRTYTDPDSGNWEVRCTSISGSGIWATATIEVCYYGGPYAQITDLSYPSSATEGDEFDCTPSVCNTGNLGGSFDIKYYEGTTLIKTVQHGRFDAGACYDNLSGRLTMPDSDLIVTVKMCLRGTSECYDERTVTISIEAVAAGNGFTIRVSNALEDKKLIVAHVAPIIGTDLWYWPQAFGYVGGEWYMAKPATTYRVEVGSIFETIPSFDKTHGTGSFADEIHCVVLAEGDGGVNTLIFKDEDVFQLFNDAPTEINLSSTSNDVITEVVMGPVCDFFGIPRGSECNSFWAEFYDPVFIANYVSIATTGKDTLGNERELHAFDHIALPFAILGSLPGLSLLPFAAIVTKGLKTAAKFGDAAVKFMLEFSMDAANKVSTKSTWYFLDAIGQVTKAHADEITNALEAGDTTLADSLLRKYAGESKGWWDYRELNEMLEAAVPKDAYNWLRTQIGLKEIGAGTVTNVAKQVPPLSTDDVAKLADAALDSGVMDEAASAVYRSLVDSKLSGGSTKGMELVNILKNSPEIGKVLVKEHKAIIDGAMSGGSLTKDSIRALANHAEFAPKDIIDMLSSYTHAEREAIITKFDVDDYQTALSNLFYIFDDAYDDVLKQMGKANTEAWVRGLGATARGTLSATFKEAKIPRAAHEYAASYADVAADMGGNIADDIVDTAETFVAKPASEWTAAGKQTVKNTSDKFWNYYESLSKAGKENIVHIMAGATLVFAAVVLYAIYTKAGPQSLNQNLFTKTMDTWYWPCYYACENKDADTLDEAIKVYEKVINECAESLYEYKDEVTADGLYDEFYRTLQLHQFNLSRMKSCLESLQPCGNIQCTSNTNFFYVDLDSEPAGFSYANYEVLLTAVKTGSHKVRIHKQNYSPECSKDVGVTAGTTKTFNCDMYLAGDCSPITAVSVYIDPLSPVEDETISFNGSAKSNDTITTWEWDFDDGSPNKTGQAVTHTFSSKGIYTVKLVVTNDCGESSSTTRNVTVSEEAVVPESTTLQIETPIGEDGNEIPRYWEVEIWVDGKDTACNPPKTLTFGTDVFCDCTSPWNLVPCELGQHTITLKKYGYDDKSISVYMKKDEPKTWSSPIMVKSSTLPTMHTVSIVVPVGSSLYVDGSNVKGTTAVGRLTAVYDNLRKR